MDRDNLSLDTMGEEELRSLAKEILPYVISQDEVEALYAVLADPELYVFDEDEGGWVAKETFDEVLKPLLDRLRGMQPTPAPQRRTVLVHLNVSVPDADQRDADSVARAVWDAFEVGRDDDSVRDLAIVVAMAEEI